MPKREIDWNTLKTLAAKLLERKNPGAEYAKRLQFELTEIEKQGANAYWCNQFNEEKKYQTNDNGLVLPWLLGLTPVDPMLGQHKIERSNDQPDIDVDLLPDARDKIKKFASERFGDEYTCSVGTWMAYKFKSAIKDAARGLGSDAKAADLMTASLPDDVDELKDDGYAPCTQCQTKHNRTMCPKCSSEDVDGTTIGKLLKEYDVLREYQAKFPEVLEMAVKLVGKIKTMGKHAGGIIITNQKLLGNVPMSINKGLDGERQWTSMWTEGRNTQLSKLGYVKWDLLGLKTLQYIHEACLLIQKNRGIKFNIPPWKGNDPEINSVGWYTDASGSVQNVPMNDPAVFQMINDIKVETVFQFETDIQKGVLANGVRDYYDLQTFNAMGHPGPIAFIPEYVKRRDDTKKTWKKREQADIADMLEETHGIIVFQEQLANIWRKFASFTAPEAEAARKAVAKKWVDKLKPVKEQWLREATKTIGPEWSTQMWDRMQTFGRYAFNKCLASGTIVIDCVTGERRAVENATGMILESSNGPDMVKAIHFNGFEPVYRVRFNNGIYEDVTVGHRYLTNDGLLTVSDLCNSAKTHSIKYIGRGVSSEDTDRSRRKASCATVSTRDGLQRHIGGPSVQIHVGPDHLQDSQEAWGDAVVPDQTAEQDQSLLSRPADAGGVLLVGDADRRWIYQREEGLLATSASTVGSGRRGEVCGVLQSQNKDLDNQTASRLQLESGCSCDGIQSSFGAAVSGAGCAAGQKREGGLCCAALPCGLCAGLHGRGRDDNHQWQGLSNGGVRGEPGVDATATCDHIGAHTRFEGQQALEVRPNSQFVATVLDRLGPMQASAGLDAPKYAPESEPEADHGGINIESVEYLGVQPVYSPEMNGPQHNYSIGPGHPIAANSHSVAYIMVAYWCAWLKVHYAPEWWASVMSGCHRDKIPRYVNTARLEGVKFGPINIEDMTRSFSVDPKTQRITPGLISVRGIGEKASLRLESPVYKRKYKDVDDFVAVVGKSKTIMEPLIKLGTFQGHHPNMHATWMWYLYKYGSGKDVTQLRKEIRAKLLQEWTPERVEKVRKDKSEGFKMLNPKKKVPSKVLNWQPPLNDTREAVMALYPDDFPIKEILKVERQYLGYYWHSPLDIYEITGGRTINSVKDSDGQCGKIEVVVEKMVMGKTKTGSRFGKLIVTDGLAGAAIMIWSDQLDVLRPFIREGLGLCIDVEYDAERNTFTLSKDSSVPIALRFKNKADEEPNE